ncbi:aspartic peptidase domain-containing protein [Lophiotrema nucula]|uniref:Aspartic peptidase domain-containing protein n=1 Tax=Lophiotrema nucula TaxID=690887 RepID=A0A6A5YHK5_9PLEO|nr:aspartic peptidase domain-containing protein [Lophiotrema nucula]
MIVVFIGRREAAVVPRLPGDVPSSTSTSATMHLRAAMILGAIGVAVATPVSRHGDSNALQKALQAGAATTERGTWAAPIATNGLVHTINITIGTPPQPFNVSLDLTSNALVVPAVYCEKYWCDYLPKQKYNASASSSYQPNGEKNTVRNNEQEYSGHLSYDTVRVNDLEIEHETFMEYESTRAVFPLGISWGFDGILGVAPPWNNGSTDFPDEQTYPNYLSLLQQKGVLKENVMSINFPHALKDYGEIMFGGTNASLYSGDFKTVKLLPDEDLTWPLQYQYTVPVTSVTFNASVPYRYETPNFKAILASEPVIYLPEKIARIIHAGIGAQELNWLWSYIPCDRRPYLPELTFEIGGHDLTITAFDYTFEYDLGEPWGKACLVWIDYNEDRNDTIVLGSTFLKGFYTKFDLENREVGCKY